jgi:hypothetical protein
VALTPGDFVFLSASVPYRAGWVEDAQPVEIEEAIISVARAVFARRARLVFGGHPSVSPLIASIAGEYHPPDPGRRDADRPVVTFQSEYFRGCLPDETWTMHRLGWTSIQWTPAVPPTAQGRGCDPRTAAPRARQDSLTTMRQWMLLGAGRPPDLEDRHGLRFPRMMIAVGGMDGVRDEAAIFLQQRVDRGIHPMPSVYAVKSGGGAAARLVDTHGAWRERLWLGQPPASAEDDHTLEGARSSGALSALEDRWRASRERLGLLDEPTPSPFQPYAAMTQWLMDTA